MSVTVLTAAPAGAPNTGSVNITNLHGTGFATGATVTFSKTGETDITATSVSVVSATKITCTVDLTGATVGLWDVTVTNTDASTGTLANGIIVFVPPTVSSIAPNTCPQNGTVNITDLEGAAFTTTVQVRLKKLGQTAILASSVVRVSATKITCTFNTVGAVLGLWDVEVKNSDTGVGTLTNGFEIWDSISAPTATSTSLAPASVIHAGTISIGAPVATSASAGLSPFQFWPAAMWHGQEFVKHTFVPAAVAANQFRVKLKHTGTEPVTIYGLEVLERLRRDRA
jgi:hypothetical protein